MRTTLIAVLVLLCASFASAQSTTVTWTNVHQTYDGFGGSTGYNERNQNMTAAVADCFFSNIDANCTAAAHSIGLEWIRIQDNATANNTPDAATVQLAYARGAKVFLSFNGPQLYTGSYASQASYMVNKILYWQNTNGVPISTVSVQNEPGSAGTTPAAIDIFIASYLGPAMAAAGLGSIPIIPGEGADWFITDYITPCLTDSNCSKYVTTVAGHGYWQSNQSGTQLVDGMNNGYQCCVDYVANLPPPIVNTNVCVNGSVPGTASKYCNIWQTELHGGFGPSSTPPIAACVNDPTIAGYDGSITNAMIWAHNFHDFFTVMNGTGWQYWNLAAQTADGPPPDCNDGLTHAYTNSPPYAPALRFYVVGNWSKYIQSGWVRIDSNPTTAQQTSGTTNPPQGVYVTAWKNGSTGTLFTIVAVNTNTVAKTLTTTLSGFPSIGGGTVTPIITSGSNNLAPQTPIAVTSNAFSYSLPANSVVTFTGAIGGSGSHTLYCGILLPSRLRDSLCGGLDGDTILGPSGGGSVHMVEFGHFHDYAGTRKWKWLLDFNPVNSPAMRRSVDAQLRKQRYFPAHLEQFSYRSSRDKFHVQQCRCSGNAEPERVCPPVSRRSYYS